MFLLVLILFFASGFSSLIYQVVWTRMLVLVFGGTTYATATVLAIFMGGLALGSWLAGKYADRVSRPFLGYGILEGLIGVWALLAPGLFDLALPAYQAIWQQFHLSMGWFSLLRFLVAGVILLPPTTCMGATLPLLSKFVSNSLDSIGQRVGTLYSSNSCGAIGGAAVAGFFLLPQFGLSAAVKIAAAINFLLCAAVIALSHRWDTLSSVNAGVAPSPSNASDTGSPIGGGKLPSNLRIAIACFAVSGAVAMVYEVAWTRALLLVIGSSTYAFTVMLCAFLTGIFLGSLVCARYIDRAREPLLWFGVCQLLLMLATIIGMRLFLYLPYWNCLINYQFLSDSNASMMVRFALAAFILTPLTVCLGAIFPALVKACTPDLESVGKSVGNLYAANTLGAIIGAFVSGFVMLPVLGMQTSLLVAGGINALLALLILTGVKALRKTMKYALVGSVALGFVVLLCGPDIWDKLVLVYAQTARRTLDKEANRPPSLSTWWQETRANKKLMFYADGTSSNVGVVQYSPDKADSVRWLLTNGHIDGSDGIDMPVQTLLGMYPMLFSPQARDVAVIGFGLGVTGGEAALFPSASLDVIELEPSVIKASPFFHHVNHDLENNPRVKLYINDGRNYLLTTDKKYDVIVSEPSNPWQAGVCNLFTREYFGICRKRLNPSGVLSIWLQTNEIDPKNIKGIIGALRSQFPHVLAMWPMVGNLVLLASDKPLSVNLSYLNTVFKDPEISADLARVGITKPEDVVARIRLGEDGVDNLTGEVEPNSDDRNKLEYEIGKSYENKSYGQANNVVFDQNIGSPWKHVRWDTGNVNAQAIEMADIAQKAAQDNNKALAANWLRQALALAPSPQILQKGNHIGLDTQELSAAEAALNQKLKLQPEDAESLLARGMIRLVFARKSEARSDLLQVLSLAPGNETAKYYLAVSYSPSVPGWSDFASGTDPAAARNPTPSDLSPAKVLAYGADLVKDPTFVKSMPRILLLVSEANWRTGHGQEACKLMQQYLSMVPHSFAATRSYGTMLYSSGQRAAGTRYLYESFELARAESSTLAERAGAQLLKGERKDALQGLSMALSIYPGNTKAKAILQNEAKHDPYAATLLATFDLPGTKR